MVASLAARNANEAIEVPTTGLVNLHLVGPIVDLYVSAIGKDLSIVTVKTFSCKI